MNATNKNVDKYLVDGCGRCSLWKTPDCKVKTWQKELLLLRPLLLGSGLSEEVKWSQPCYTYERKIVVMMTTFKEYCALGFFKGALLKDAKGILVSPGENSQAMRQLRFTDVKQITKMKATIKSYIMEAIKIEESGAKVIIKKKSEPIPEELQNKFNENPRFKQSFEGLTPGRQRGYILFFAGAKQSKTRESRIEKYIPKILAGKGLYD